MRCTHVENGLRLGYLPLIRRSGKRLPPRIEEFKLKANRGTAGIVSENRLPIILNCEIIVNVVMAIFVVNIRGYPSIKTNRTQSWYK